MSEYGYPSVIKTRNLKLIGSLQDQCILLDEEKQNLQLIGSSQEQIIILDDRKQSQSILKPQQQKAGKLTIVKSFFHIPQNRRILTKNRLTRLMQKDFKVNVYSNSLWFRILRSTTQAEFSTFYIGHQKKVVSCWKNYELINEEYHQPGVNLLKLIQNIKFSKMISLTINNLIDVSNTVFSYAESLQFIDMPQIRKISLQINHIQSTKAFEKLKLDDLVIRTFQAQKTFPQTNPPQKIPSQQTIRPQTIRPKITPPQRIPVQRIPLQRNPLQRIPPQRINVDNIQIDEAGYFKIQEFPLNTKVIKCLLRKFNLRKPPLELTHQSYYQTLRKTCKDIEDISFD